MKNLSKIIAGLLLGSVLIITSCKRDDHNYTVNNQDFVTKASSANMFEIAAGNLAINNSSNADVKAFGNHMIADHGQTATEMAQLASKKNWMLPTAMAPKEQNNYNMLAGLTGTAFDKKYAAMMVSSHQETITLFEFAAGNNGVPDADLRGFASNKLPTLKTHLQHAQQLQTQVGQ